MSELKKIAIVLASYNPNEVFFKEQIESLRRQTYKNWNCIISDDNSDDVHTHVIMNEIQSDPRFIFIRNPGKRGAYFNFENALKNVNAEYDLIAFCDQDDIWAENKLEKMQSLFVDPSIQVAHSDLVLIDKLGNTISKSCWSVENRDLSYDDYYAFFLRNNITGCSMMFRRELLDVALPFPVQEKQVGFYHDHWVALLGRLRGNIAVLTQPLIYYRQHGNNVVGAQFKSNKTMLKKIMGLGQIFDRARWAYIQRNLLYKSLISRIPSAANNLTIWECGTIAFSFDLIRRALKNTSLFRLAVQLIIGRFILQGTRNENEDRNYKLRS